MTLNLLSIKYNLYQKEVTAEHCKDRQLIMYPNCNISLKWRAQQGWVHLKLVMLQPGAYNASKTCKQVGKIGLLLWSNIERQGVIKRGDKSHNTGH